MTANRGLKKSPSTSDTDPQLQGCIEGEATMLSASLGLPMQRQKHCSNQGCLLKAVKIMEKELKG